MLLIDITSTIIATTETGELLLAFMDGADGKERVCVALLRATPAVARALCVSISSALKEPREQPLTPIHLAAHTSAEEQTADDDP